MTGTPLRWGVLGPGRIADEVAADLALVEGATLQAVGSRSRERARAFADRHGAAASYGSYGALLDDPDVDVVYIATPHRQHHALALAALEAGKHLLVEKAFTCTLEGAREVAAAARRSGRFCMEAMWTRFQPAMGRAIQLVRDGAVGEVRQVRADLGLAEPYDPMNRLWDPSQGGGALLDLGVYPVAFLQQVLGGTPAALRVAGDLGPRGAVDAEVALLWQGEQGRVGLAQCSLRSPLPGGAGVFGTEGWLELPPRFHHPTRLVVHPLGGDSRTSEPRSEDLPAIGGGYAHELAEVHRCVGAGLTESPTMPLDDTLAVMEVLEGALHALGLRPDEDPSVPL